MPAINAISDAPTVVNAVAQLAPSNAALGASQVTFEGERAFQGLLASHLGDGMCSQGSQADDQRKRDDQHKPNDGSSSCQSSPYSGLRVKGFGNFGDQGAQGAFSGYTSTVLGAMVGFDEAIADDTRAGLGIGYAHSRIDGKGIGNNTTGFNTERITAYVTHEDGTWFADGDISYGANSYSGQRQIIFTGLNRTAIAKYSGSDATSFVTAGRHFLADDYTITPLASLQATHLGINGYTETGAGDIDLQVASQNYNFLESGLGVNVAQNYDLDDGRELLPEVHFNGFTNCSARIRIIPPRSRQRARRLLSPKV